MAVTLQYDPDSPFTWVDADRLARLDLPVYRHRRISVPGTDEFLEVTTVMVRVSVGIFHGVDEIVVAPNAALTRLGARSLHAVQAYFEDQPADEANPVLMPLSTPEPFARFRERARRVVSEESLPLHPDSLERAALAVRFFTTLLGRGTTLNYRSIAEGLFVTLQRLVQCRRVAVYGRPSRRRAWIKYKTRAEGFEDLDLAAIDSSREVRLPGGCGQALVWRFPASPDVFQCESEILCHVETESQGEYHLLHRAFRLLSPVIDILLSQGDWADAMRASRDDAREVLAFPRTHDHIVSYRLLEDARGVLPKFTHLSCWRTSRNFRNLERVAEHYDPPRSFEPGRIDAWLSPEVALDSDDLLLIAVPPGVAHTPRGIGIRAALGEPDPVMLTCAIEQQASWEVFVTSKGPRLDPKGRESVQRQRSIVERNVASLLRSLRLRGSEMVVISWSFLPGRGLRPRGTPEDFHLLVAMVGDGLIPSDINRGALASLRRALSLRLFAYDALSWSRYRLRQVGDFVSEIHSARSLEELRDRVQACLEALLPTAMFLLVSSPDGRVLAADSDLRDWEGRSLTLPPLESRAPRVVRDLAHDAPSDLVALARSVLDVRAKSRQGSLERRPRRSTEPRRVIGWRAGAAFVKLSDAVTLLVVSDGIEGWIISSTEHSALRVLSAALESAEPLVGSPAAEKPAAGSGSRVDSGEFFERLMHKTTGIPSLLQEVLDELRQELSGVVPGFADTRPVLLAVDGAQRFCRAIAGLAKRESPVPLVASSIVAHALRTRGDDAPFGITVARIEANGESAQILRETLEPAGEGVRFHHLVEAEPGDLIVVRGFTRSNGKPLGFLVVPLPGQRGAHDVESVRRACERISASADRAALLLQRQIELRASVMRREIEAPLQRLRDGEGSTLLKLSELGADRQRPTRHLPTPLRRLFTAEYCGNLQRILERVAASTQMYSLSCRVRYPDATGEEKLWRLACAGDVAQWSDSLVFDVDRNVHSFACGTSTPSQTGEGGEDQRNGLVSCVFLGDVGTQAEAVNAELYPGVVYQSMHPLTAAELCFGFAIAGAERLRVTFNIEHTSFLDLWLLEEFFRQTATAVVGEVALHYRRAETADRNGVNLGAMFLSSVAHNIAREVPAFAAHIAREAPALAGKPLDTQTMRRITLDTAIADAMTMGSTRRLDRCIGEGCDKFMALLPDAPRIELLSCHKNALEIYVPDSFRLLLCKLLLEQADTLTKTGFDGTRLFGVGWRHSTDGRQVIVDVLNTVPPLRLETRALAEALFWYEIDDLQRERKGRGGRGLYLLGQMLRVIGCHPAALAEPSPSAVAAYSLIDERRRLRFPGFALELRFGVSILPVGKDPADDRVASGESLA